MDSEKLIRETLPLSLSDLWGIPKSGVISVLEKSLQETVETIALEIAEVDGRVDHETCIELIYESPLERERLADEVIESLRPIECDFEH